MVYGFTFVCFVVGQLLAFLGWRIDLSEFRGIMTGVGWVNDGPLLPGLCSSHLLDGFSKRQLDVGSSLCFHWAIDLCHAIYCTKHAWAGEPGEKMQSSEPKKWPLRVRKDTSFAWYNSITSVKNELKFSFRKGLFHLWWFQKGQKWGIWSLCPWLRWPTRRPPPR